MTNSNIQGSSVGERIVALRKEIGWSQKRLAEEAGISGGALSKIESGKVKNPSYLVNKEICAALNILEYEIKCDQLDEDEIQLRNKKFYMKFGVINELCGADQDLLLRFAERLAN